jgi:hypothetical protein
VAAEGRVGGVGVVPGAGGQLHHAGADVLGERDAGQAAAAVVEQADDRPVAASASWLVNPAATRARRSSAPRNAMREHDVTALTAAELEAVRRELAASLALARPGSSVCAPIQAHLAAIDAELAGRAAARHGLPGFPRARPPDSGHAG